MKEIMKSTSSDMMLSRAGTGRIPPRKLGLVAVVTCLLLPFVFLAVLKPNLDPFSIWKLELSIQTSVQLARIKLVKEDSSDSQPPGTETTIVPLALKVEKENPSRKVFNANLEMRTSPLEKEEEKPISVISLPDKEMQIEKNKITSNGTEMAKYSTPNFEEIKSENKSGAGVVNSGTETIIVPLALNVEKENKSRKVFNASLEMRTSPLRKRKLSQFQILK